MTGTYDLVVIASGPAGERAAELAESFSRRSAMIVGLVNNARSVAALGWTALLCPEVQPDEGLVSILLTDSHCELESVEWKRVDGSPSVLVWAV